MYVCVYECMYERICMLHAYKKMLIPSQIAFFDCVQRINDSVYLLIYTVYSTDSEIPTIIDPGNLW